MLGRGTAQSHTPSAVFLLKRFSAHLRQLVKWETMMLQVQAKARVPQRCPQFSAGSTPIEMNMVIF